jgi:ActR/RegA family two-component response regulator
LTCVKARQDCRRIGVNEKAELMKNGKTILIVNENQTSLNLLRGHFESQGYIVYAELGASAALKRLQLLHKNIVAVDAALVDPCMSDGSGVDMIDHLMIYHRAIKVVLLARYCPLAKNFKFEVAVPSVVKALKDELFKSQGGITQAEHASILRKHHKALMASAREENAKAARLERLRIFEARKAAWIKKNQPEEWAQIQEIAAYRNSSKS